MKTIVHVVGARPNYMKIAPLMDALSRQTAFAQVLVNTGQHYDENMAGSFFSELQLPRPDRNLGVGSGSHAAQTARVMTGFEEVCIEERPDLVVVVGDVIPEPLSNVIGIDAAQYCAAASHALED